MAPAIISGMSTPPAIACNASSPPYSFRHSNCSTLKGNDAPRSEIASSHFRTLINVEMSGTLPEASSTISCCDIASTRQTCAFSLCKGSGVGVDVEYGVAVGAGVGADAGVCSEDPHAATKSVMASNVPTTHMRSGFLILGPPFPEDPSWSSCSPPASSEGTSSAC